MREQSVLKSTDVNFIIDSKLQTTHLSITKGIYDEELCGILYPFVLVCLLLVQPACHISVTKSQ